MPTESDPLSRTFDVVIGGSTVDGANVGGETYVFRKPGIYYSIEMGYRAADVRRRAFPAGGGGFPGDFGLDYSAVSFARACAITELYLERSDQEWPYSPGPDGKPLVDSSKFPPDREETVIQVGNAFEAEMARFRTRRNPDKPPAGPEAVAGQ